ncbi:hypothetical protein [Altericroceibacterium xinjiangense]|uniref:hypothetical protein n=1 Tax=Altericroceibacterium xinjiangense TaxID=762261 RepID=UPI000F7D6CA2|nr:hypothetical protein [Altericroceibacterium xinjiangense]
MTRGAFAGLLETLTGTSGDRLAPNARYTENGQELPVGDGLWATADRVGPYVHRFVDAEAGTFACFTTLLEGRTRSHLAVRAQVAGGTIREIEAVAARPELFGTGGAFGDGPAELDKSGAPAPEWSAAVPQAQQMSRDDLRRVANQYFSGLERNDGQGDYPFSDDCLRIENGFRTTQVPPKPTEGRETPYAEDFRALTARQQFETGYFRFVDRIRDRRFPVIDPERGLVFALAFFDHSGTVREYDLADGTRITGAVDRPFSWMIAEGFRIEQGLIRRIEAIMTAVPYGMRPGWPLQDGDIG